MKVGLVIYGSLDILTGGFIFDRKLVDHIQGDGSTVEVFSLPWRNYVFHITDNFSYKFIKRLKRSSCDILLEDELNHPSLLSANYLLKQSKKFPVVSIVHHLRSSELRSKIANHFYRKVEQIYLTSVDGYVFNSATTRDSVRQLGLPPKPSVTAYPGRKPGSRLVDVEFIRKRSHSRGPLRILFVGALIPRKQLDTLLEALSSLPKSEWLLRVVGALETDKNYADTISKLLKRLDLEKNVRLLGSMSQEELDSEYLNCHVLAVPSSYEGFGIVYLESMGFGAPPLASTAGAAHEVISDGRNGFLVRPGDVSAIAEKLGQLANDRDLLFEMGKAALDSFITHPTWDQSCAKIFNFMKEMVGKNHV
ncbi:MAG: glycosyltransferase family 4 protein [Desulfomonilaceae bacterium]